MADVKPVYTFDPSGYVRRTDPDGTVSHHAMDGSLVFVEDPPAGHLDELATGARAATPTTTETSG